MKDFCLAHLFTDIKFEGGILGLAYVGSPRRNSVGGICTPEYFKNGYTLYLNSGLSSSRNHYGQRQLFIIFCKGLPSKRSTLKLISLKGKYFAKLILYCGHH